jgi:hypothetical protein
MASVLKSASRLMRGKRASAMRRVRRRPVRSSISADRISGEIGQVGLPFADGDLGQAGGVGADGGQLELAGGGADGGQGSGVGDGSHRLLRDSSRS